VHSAIESGSFIYKATSSRIIEVKVNLNKAGLYKHY